MKPVIFISSALLLAATAAQAQEQGRVISSTPVYQQVAVQRPSCTVQQVAVQPPKSGAGALMGAVAGGALGNAVGGGAGRAVATMAGVMGGAILGDSIEGSGPAQVSNVQQCSTQTVYENRAVGYNVVYEYGGRQYSAQMPNDPGPTVQLQVSPVAQQAAAPVTAPMYAPVYAPPVAQTVYTETYPTTTYVNAPPVVYAAPTYYAPSYYPAVTFGLGLGLGYWGGWRGGYHGGGRHHWR